MAVQISAGSTPSAALDRYVRLRDRTCRFPGCNRHHHRLKHEGNWTVRRNPDGSHTWTSPTGRQYRDDNPDP
jgi:hypothetical protein